MLRDGDLSHLPLSVHPWMVLRHCAGCDVDRVLLLDCHDADGDRYLCMACGSMSMTPSVGRNSLERASAPLTALTRESPNTRIRDEDVQFTVYRRNAVRPGRWYPMLAFAHKTEPSDDPDFGPADPVEEVKRQAEQSLGAAAASYRSSGLDSSSAIPRGDELRFVPFVEGVEFNPASHSFLWLEAVHRAEFRLRANPALDGTQVRGRMDVLLGPMLVAAVPISFRVDAASADETTPVPTPPESARPYRRIFASYSHADVAIVDQVAAFAALQGDEFIRDWTHLRAGEVWDARLARLIEESDLFQLFWSTNALASPFVRQEWSHALSLGRAHFIRPFYWEEPMPVRPELNLPPAELVRLQFSKLNLAPWTSVASGPVVNAIPAPSAPAAPTPSSPLPAAAGSYQPAWTSPTQALPPYGTSPPVAAPGRGSPTRGSRVLAGRRALPVAGGVVGVGAAAVSALVLLGAQHSASPPAGVVPSPPSAAIAPQIVSSGADSSQLCIAGNPRSAHVDVHIAGAGVTAVTLVVRRDGIETQQPMVSAPGGDARDVLASPAPDEMVWLGTLGPFSNSGSAVWFVVVADGQGRSVTSDGHGITVTSSCP